MPARSDLAWRVVAYNVLLIPLAILGLPWIALRWLVLPSRRRNVRERLGAAPRGEGRAVWVHAVSVGEVRAAAPMLPLLREGLGAGGRILLSTVTLTGRRTAQRECPEADSVFHFPVDLPWLAGRALDRARPSVFVTVETELWPNFLAACFGRGIPVAVVNGRISDRSFGRYRALRWFFAPFLERVSAFLMQSPTDAARVVEMGAPPERVRVTGNAKYDRRPSAAEAAPGFAAWAAGAPLLAAGSTHEGEEAALLEVLRRPAAARLRLALVPRHPERFDRVASLLEQAGVPFVRWSRMGRDGEAGKGARVLLVDAMGVLDGVYRLADLAFVGGSLVPVGGHNLLEPAMLGKPVLAGPHLANFRDIAGDLAAAGGCRVVADAAELAAAVDELLGDRTLRERMGRAAREAAERSAGASRANAAAVLELAGVPG